jgi:hypothetical protein
MIDYAQKVGDLLIQVKDEEERLVVRQLVICLDRIFLTLLLIFPQWGRQSIVG